MRDMVAICEARRRRESEQDLIEYESFSGDDVTKLLALVAEPIGRIEYVTGT